MKKKEITFHLESKKAFPWLQLEESKQTTFCRVFRKFSTPVKHN